MTDLTTSQKTEKVSGIFTVTRCGFGCCHNMGFETPYVILTHQPTGREFKYHSDKAIDFHTGETGQSYKMSLRVRGSKVWRILTTERA